MSDSTLGLLLKQARTARKLSIKQASKAIHIREEYLQAIEKDRLEELPSAVQSRGFIRLYGSYLGVDEAEIENFIRPVVSEVVVTPDWTEPEPKPQSDIREKINRWLRTIVHSSPKIAQKNEPIPEQGYAPVVDISEDKFNRPSDELLAQIGRQLEDQRTRVSMTLENVETYTHIPAHYLKALETGNMEELPSPVQGRGMLSNYAAFLDLDVDALLLEYADALQLRREETGSGNITG